MRSRMAAVVVGGCCLVAALGYGQAVQAQTALTGRLHQAVRTVCPAIVGISIGDRNDRATWKVEPLSQQACAQATLTTFDPDAPSVVDAELDAEVKQAMDNERLSAAIVWTILKQMFPGDTDPQTKVKFGVARTRIIDAFKVQPWK